MTKEQKTASLKRREELLFMERLTITEKEKYLKNKLKAS